MEWSPPRDTGGRGDITYSLHCRKCSGDGRKCMPCGSSVHFVPRQYGLSSAMVLVTDLQPDSNYSFTVESQNGVSDLSPSLRGKVVINVTTSQTGKSILPELNYIFKDLNCSKSMITTKGFCRISLISTFKG